MKKAILYSALALGSLSLASCGDSFLELDPAGSVSEGTLTTAEGVDYVLTGAYASMYNMTQAQWMGGASPSNWTFGDIAGADANKGSQSTDQPDLTQLEIFAFSSSNSYLLSKWNAAFEGIKRANNALSIAKKLGDALPNKDQVEGQALFIKSFWNFEAIRVFGAAFPYVSLDAYEASTDPDITNVNESGDYVFIWSKVEADLKEAIDKLPATWSEGEYGRATSWMAKALLAKLYLYWSSPYVDGATMNGNADHWADCRELLNDIMNNGVDAKGQRYKLADSYAELFNAATSDWTGESVFDIQATISGTQTDTNTQNHSWAIGLPGASGVGGWGFYQPTYNFVNTFIVDENGLPAADYAGREPLSHKEGSEIVSDLTTYTDPRIEECIGRFGVPFLDYGVPVTANAASWVRDTSNGGVYMNKKNQPFISDRGSTSESTVSVSSAKNYHCIRYAEILLMRAEVAIHDGELATAQELINQVRKRAANSVPMAADNEVYYAAADMDTPTGYTLDDKANGRTVTGTVANYRIGLYTTPFTQETATTALRREYRAEFGMEGHHWFDLARWGVAAEELNKFRDYENQYINKYTNPYNEKWVTYPVPLTELQTAAGRFVQTPYWK